MTIWLAIFYGILQGATEFLPVSSSGHLVLFSKIFGVECNFIFFSLLLHLATLFAVFLVLRKEIWEIFKHPFSVEARKLYIATIPTILIVLLFKSFFEDAFLGSALPVCFMLTAVFLFFAEVIKRKKITPITNKTAFIMGVFQGVAVLPGISRSGATIVAGVLSGAERKEVSKFSFLMSVPIIFASMAYEIFESLISGEPLLNAPILPTILAFVAAFIVGLLCVKFMINAISKIKLYYFSIYLIFISIISLFIL